MNNQKGIAQIAILIILLIGIAGGVYLVQQTQIFKPRAYEENDLTSVSSCREITQSGNYLLTQDLQADAESVCINIHDVSNVNLDCDNHSVKSEKPLYIEDYLEDDGPSRPILAGPLMVNNAQDFSIKNCNFPGNNPVSLDKDDIVIYKSNNGSITASFFEKHEVFVKDSNKIVFGNNTLNTATYYQNSTNNSIISNNKFTIIDGSDKFFSGALISSGGGENNQIINNIIDGGSTKHKVGADDAIILGEERDATLGERGALVKNNTVSNTWDCGIETAGLVKDSVISHNKITNTGDCGIGAWFSNHWIGNSVSDNEVSNTQRLFAFWYSTRVEAPNYAIFKDNIFSNNVFHRKIDATRKESSEFWLNGVQDIVSGNIFKDNHFGYEKPPEFNPSSGVIDGGGNYCSKGLYNHLTCIPDASSRRIQTFDEPTEEALKEEARRVESEIKEHIQQFSK